MSIFTIAKIAANIAAIGMLALLYYLSYSWLYIGYGLHPLACLPLSIATIAVLAWVNNQPAEQARDSDRTVNRLAGMAQS